MTPSPDLLLKRGDTFKLLAACFYEPDKELFEEQRVCQNLIGLLQHTAPSAVEPASNMANELALNDQKRLRIDHAALFVGPFHLPAAPYGSVYGDDRRRLMSDSTMAAKKFYDDAGLVVDMQEPADHIVIELEFMYYLCRKEAGAYADNLPEEAEKFRSLQVAFFKHCLEPWVPSFCSAIKASATNRFFSALAETLEAYIRACAELYAVESEPAT